MREYLRNLRTERNNTMDQVATSLGITRQYYNMIEKGTRKNSMDTAMLYKMANYYEVDFARLAYKEIEWLKGQGKL